MDADDIQSYSCANTDFYNTQKRVTEILEGTTPHVLNKSKVSCNVSRSRYSSRCRRSDISRFSSNASIRRSEMRGSHSLINLKNISSLTSSIANKRKSKPVKSYEFDKSGSQSNESDSDNDTEGRESAPSPKLVSSNNRCCVSHFKSHKGKCSVDASAYSKLSSVVHQLNSTLFNIHNVGISPCGKSKSRHLKQLKTSRISIPSSHEKDCLTKLSTAIHFLSEKMEKEVSVLLVSSSKDKTQLEHVLNDNVILKQRLANSLNMQRNLEGELKLMEEENKNLAVKIVPFIPTRPQTVWQPPPKSRGSGQPVNVFYRNNGRDHRNKRGDRNNNNCGDGEDEDCDGSGVTLSPSMSEQFEPRCGEISPQNDANYKYPRVDNPFGGEVEGGEESSRKTADDLDTIKSYLWEKDTDFKRLHGRLTKNLEEVEKLRETVGVISQEREEILTDLEDLVDSYREVEKERDNYASILKLILKEKNSSESNLFELLDGLLGHLNNCPVDNHDYQKRGAGGFLESALHVMQEQNISIREEIARVMESLQKTTGQNMLLQQNNQELKGKVEKLQREVEKKETGSEEKERDAREKYEQLDKLYRTVSSAKDGLDICLKEREGEIRKLRDVLEASEKACSRQAKKILELEKEKGKLGKELEDRKKYNDNLKQMMAKQNSSSKYEKGRWEERMKATTNDLQQSKEHCKWLQSQIDNLNSQLLEAHERNKAQEEDKIALARKVLSAEEERKVLDRKVFDIKSMMHGDTVLKTALAERNELLQSEINRLRRGQALSESLNTGQLELFSKSPKRGDKETSRNFMGDQSHTLDDLSSITSAPREKSYPSQGNRDVTPLSRRQRNANHIRKHHHQEVPRTAVSLHNPSVLCYNSVAK